MLQSEVVVPHGSPETSLNFHQNVRRHPQKIINIKQTAVFVHQKNILLTVLLSLHVIRNQVSVYNLGTRKQIILIRIPFQIYLTALRLTT